MSLSTHQAAYSNEKAERLEARLSRVQKELIQRAADLQGRTVTDFVISCSQEMAKKVIVEHQTVVLTMEESERFVNALLDAPEPNAALQQAAQRYYKLVNNDD
ncbi:MAG: hypothetical protein CMF50_05490 [Legionellales bacterium]|nr:hypothetical protein [Legionellales bacterium]|tara:strand:+ start:14127 stop:14435 length:309 start_codon:yes stop_codon:yes gene_type:complete